MRTLLIILALTSVACPIALADDLTLSTGEAVTTVLPSLGSGLRDYNLLLNGDGTWENGFTWGPMGTVAPDFGGFGEGYSGEGTLMGVRLLLTTMPEYFGGEIADIYIYASDGDNPTNVISVISGIEIDPPALWPTISTYDIDIPPVDINGDFFVYLWGDFSENVGWFMTVDMDGDNGLPRTKIAPGVGFPEGWQDPSVVWGHIASVGIGAYFQSETTPVEASTWGEVKALFR